MESKNEKVSEQDIIDNYIMNHDEMVNISYSNAKNYQMLKNVIHLYNEKLEKILNLSRHHEMKLFFREQNDQLLFLKNEYKSISDKKLFNILMEIITKQISLNLFHARKNLLSKDNST